MKKNGLKLRHTKIAVKYFHFDSDKKSTDRNRNEKG